ncbi:MAG TPA: hypothetical protein VN044_02485 [Verrucomicrobiae bacterium]|nr:hypothetical protein [Verrucomicrobiae bacterium]
MRSLMDGMIAANERIEGALDPVLQAATAFGFVYVPPFEDGNGRLHRCPDPSRSGRRQIRPPRPWCSRCRRLCSIASRITVAPHARIRDRS